MTKRINSPDTESDIKLRECLEKKPRNSFVMVAGAGSGKTTSLVKALNYIVSTQGASLKRKGQKIACITYTDIAAEEIWNDVGNSPLTHVSTIHRFFWTVIRPFQADIKIWVSDKIKRELASLEAEARSFGPRVQQKTRDKNTLQIARYKDLQQQIQSISEFTYEIGSDYSKGVLGHNDIIELVTSLIQQNSLLRTIIRQKYPYIFIDESQDTFPEIVKALKSLDEKTTLDFCLGFFGDPMQKIYAQGEGEISLENGWEKITKEENFRCSQHVLKLINNIRRDGDALCQVGGRVENIKGENVYVEGSAQIFVLPADAYRTENLKKVQYWCAGTFEDESWNHEDKIKIFVVVHRMVANRLGFPNLYSAMNDKAPTSFSERFIEGTAWPLKPFLSFVLPLVECIRAGDSFGALSVLRERCPLLVKDKLKGDELAGILHHLKESVDQLTAMMGENSTATVRDIVCFLRENKLMELEDRLLLYLDQTPNRQLDGDDQDQAKQMAMQKYFACSANEFWGYKKYYEDESPFATQQGIKGAQFNRVMTILDDDEGAGHKLFSYNKYFGLVPLSSTDESNISDGKDHVIARTRRLFYVSCSRAMKDLVVVYYVPDVKKALTAVKNQNLFLEENIYTLDDLTM